MKILLVSERFAPSIGGVETVTRLIGGALIEAGHRVTLVTNERVHEEEAGPWQAWRRPSAFQLVAAYRAADAVILQGPAMRLGWPLLLCDKRALMVHHAWPGVRRNRLTQSVRQVLGRRVRHASVSEALARVLPWPIGAILPNPYDETVFCQDSKLPRDLDVAFVGRLVPEKGAQVLVEALSILDRSGVALKASIVGTGPDRDQLVQLLGERKLESRVWLAGSVTGPALAGLLNRHRVLVVPSLCAEGFGLVALEAIACGCIVLGSRAGGLPEAIGPCGVTFPAGDAPMLAAALAGVLGSSSEVERLRAGADSHLARHQPGAVARRYLEVLNVGAASSPVRSAQPHEARAGTARCVL